MNIRVLGRIILVFLLIFVFGLIIGLLGGFIGSRVLGDGFSGWGGLVGALAGMVLGYPTGVILGLIIVKKVLKYKGSLIGGSAGVIISSVLIMILAEPLNPDTGTDILLVVYFVLIPLLGLTGYSLAGGLDNWRRRADSNR